MDNYICVYIMNKDKKVKKINRKYKKNKKTIKMKGGRRNTSKVNKKFSSKKTQYGGLNEKQEINVQQICKDLLSCCEGIHNNFSNNTEVSIEMMTILIRLLNEMEVIKRPPEDITQDLLKDNGYEINLLDSDGNGNEYIAKSIQESELKYRTFRAVIQNYLENKIDITKKQTQKTIEKVTEIEE